MSMLKVNRYSFLKIPIEITFTAASTQTFAVPSSKSRNKQRWREEGKKAEERDKVPSRLHKDDPVLVHHHHVWRSPPHQRLRDLEKCLCFLHNLYNM